MEREPKKKKKQKEKRKKEGGGRGEERKRLQKLQDFEKPARQQAWLARLVEHFWHVSIKGLFHNERSWHVY